MFIFCWIRELKKGMDKENPALARGWRWKNAHKLLILWTLRKVKIYRDTEFREKGRVGKRQNSMVYFGMEFQEERREEKWLEREFFLAGTARGRGRAWGEGECWNQLPNLLRNFLHEEPRWGWIQSQPWNIHGINLRDSKPKILI